MQYSEVKGFDGCHIKPCCWAMFWKKNHGKLFIPNALKDVCNDCFILSHSFCFFSRGNDNTETGAVNNYKLRELAVKVVAVHVERAAAQRKYFNDVV